MMLAKCTHILARETVLFQCVRINKRFMNHASLSRPRKEKYPLQYKVKIVNQDGSTYTTRYHQPMGVIHLPLDPKSLTNEEMKARLKKMRSEKKVHITEYKEDVAFDRRATASLMRKKK